MEIPWSTPGKTKATQLTAYTAKDNIERNFGKTKDKEYSHAKMDSSNLPSTSESSTLNCCLQQGSTTSGFICFMFLNHVSSQAIKLCDQAMILKNHQQSTRKWNKSVQMNSWTRSWNCSLKPVQSASLCEVCVTIALSRAIRNSRKHTQAKSTPHDIYTTKTQFQQFNTS